MLALSCNFIALSLGLNCVKDLKVTKIVKNFKFENVWGQLEAKNCFQRQAFTKYLKVTLVFMRNSALREKFNFCFSRFFC